MKDWKCPQKDFLHLIGHMNQLAGIRRFRFIEGKASGIEAAEVHTGSGLVYTVLPGRGMDIAWVSYKGIPLNYMSKTGIVSPTYYESSGKEWLRTFFAGALTTCGLQNVGNPETYQAHTMGEAEFGLHGRISNCAAEQVCVYEDFEEEGYTMRVSGKMQEAMLHEEHLSLRRTFTSLLGEKEFILHDTVTNHSQYDQPTMLMYHINFGYPLVNEGTRIVAPSKERTLITGIAEKHPDRWTVCEAPTPFCQEGGYAHDMMANKKGEVHICIINDALELGVEISYLKKDLPFFNQWKVMRHKEYVIGFEPGNTLPIGRNAMGDAVEILKPNGKKQVEVHYRILDGVEEIREAENRVSLCTY